MDGSCGGGSSCPAAAREQIPYFFGEQIQLPFSSSSSPPECGERGDGFPGVDQLECDFEEDGAKPAAPSRGGSGSKRSRAAEVHNLSEKRRRSRINEKMRALQNLIPNSNKLYMPEQTDKASMLDEAIEYLKQLQLQVQMLSMRNGLNLHDMYLSTMVQSPLQASEICMGFNGENRIAMNTGQGMFSHNHQSLSQQIQNIVTSLAAPQESFQIPMTAERGRPSTWLVRDFSGPKWLFGTGAFAIASSQALPHSTTSFLSTATWQNTRQNEKLLSPQIREKNRYNAFILWAKKCIF